MKKTIFLLLILATACCQLSVAQKENNIWCFGNKAGLNFNSGTPVAISGAQINTSEGSASVADSNGSLLFYTDGVRVWNRNHLVMPNGFGLMGDLSSSQAALAVKQPGNTNIYVLFTTAAFGFGGAYYSFIDMNLNGGLGDVVTAKKNVALVNPVAEGLSAAYHSNKNDVWVTLHSDNGKGFYAYLVTSAGVNAPVITNTGCVIVSSNSPVGCMKISSKGNKATIAHRNDTVQVLDFNNTTGVFSNPYYLTKFKTSYYYAYGVEFSPNERFLYVTEEDYYDSCHLYQFDLLAGSPAAVNASRMILSTDYSHSFGSLQLGPDNKIYVAHDSLYTLGVINYPDSLKAACQYNSSGVSLTGMCLMGLPDFLVKSKTGKPPVAKFFSSDTAFCGESGSCIDFTDISTDNPTSWKWSFPGAVPDTSTQQNPTSICYTTPGTFAVSLIASNSNGSDTLMVSSMIIFASSAAPPVLTFTGDTIFCSHASSYQWYFNGSPIPLATDSFYVVTGDGVYAVQITDANGCNRLSNGLPISVKELSGAGGIGIYPNPVKDQFTVSGLSRTYGIGALIEVYDVLGHRVYSGIVNSKQETINSKQFAAGIYVVELASGEKIFRSKFVKE